MEVEGFSDLAGAVVMADSASAMRFSAATFWRPARELEARAFL